MIIKTSERTDCAKGHMASIFIIILRASGQSVEPPPSPPSDLIDTGEERRLQSRERDAQVKFRLDLSDEEAVTYIQNMNDVSATAVMAVPVEQPHKFAQHWRQ